MKTNEFIHQSFEYQGISFHWFIHILCSPPCPTTLHFLQTPTHQGNPAISQSSQMRPSAAPGANMTYATQEFAAGLSYPGRTPRSPQGKQTSSPLCLHVLSSSLASRFPLRLLSWLLALLVVQQRKNKFPSILLSSWLRPCNKRLTREKQRFINTETSCIYGTPRKR